MTPSAHAPGDHLVVAACAKSPKEITPALRASRIEMGLVCAKVYARIKRVGNNWGGGMRRHEKNHRQA